MKNTVKSRNLGRINFVSIITTLIVLVELTVAWKTYVHADHAININKYYELINYKWLFS